MMDFGAYQQSLGATLASDGIALHYGDPDSEFTASLSSVVLMDRSHEGRLELTGRDRLAIPQRMSTGDVGALNVGEGVATLFTTPNARILDRAVIASLNERALALTEPGRGGALRAYLQRNVFFNDELRIRDISGETRSFALHGPAADALMNGLSPEISLLPVFGVKEFTLGSSSVIALRLKPLAAAAWVLLVGLSAADVLHAEIRERGAEYQLRLAGSLAYNMLRIYAGRPGVGRELSGEYIPLEVGLWDEVSFTKGCYTGQEIIARMESRGRLARTIMRVRLDGALNAPADLMAEGKHAGVLTSAVSLQGEHVGIAVVRMAFAQPGRVLMAGDTAVHITGYAGAQPPGLREEEAVDG